MFLKISLFFLAGSILSISQAQQASTTKPKTTKANPSTLTLSSVGVAQISDSVVFTQKTSQSLNQAIAETTLFASEKQIISQLPVISKTKTPRQFWLKFTPSAESGGKRQLQEIHVATKTSLVVFDVIKKEQAYQFISNAQKRQTSLGASLVLASSKTVAQKQISSSVKNSAINSATKLVKTEPSKSNNKLKSNQLVTKNTAKSTPEKSLPEKVLPIKPPRLESIPEKSTSNKPSTSQAAIHLASLAVKSKVQSKPKPDTKSVTAKATVTSSEKRSHTWEKDLGTAVYLRFRQREGEVLEDVVKQQNLSKAQKQIIVQLPIRKTTSGHRDFHLYFVKDQGQRYLRAIKVVRGDNSAEFALILEKGRVILVDESGKAFGSGESSTSFARYPVAFQRISSHFNPHRRHPITRRVRPHEGVDFKVAYGAPIHAPATGVINFSGRQRGFGKFVSIDHQNGYVTRYAHLSRIPSSIRNGVHVKKGQVIGYAGSTGASTGVHLHYEILVNGVPRNPLTVKLPKMAASQSPGQYQQAAKQYLGKLTQTIKRYP